MVILAEYDKTLDSAWTPSYYWLPRTKKRLGQAEQVKDSSIPLLHIAFQDGFADDSVVVQVNDEEVFRKRGVRTRHQISHADSFEIDVQEGPVSVVVALPSRSLSGSTALEVSAPTYLGVSVTLEGELEYRIQHEPFGYV